MLRELHSGCLRISHSTHLARRQTNPCSSASS